MMNKRAMVLSIVLLVFATLFIVAFALIAFSSKSDNVNKGFASGIDKLNYIYGRELTLNYYIQDAVDRAGKNSNDRESFIIQIKKVLDGYKYSDGSLIFPEFLDVEKQLDNSVSYNIINGKGQIAVKLNIVIDESANGINSKGIFVDQSGVVVKDAYQKEFDVSL